MSGRGGLRIHLGPAPGVGRTFAMPGEARRHRAGTMPDGLVGRAEQIELVDITATRLMGGPLTVADAPGGGLAVVVSLPAAEP